MSQDLHSDNGIFSSIISEPLDELSKFTVGKQLGKIQPFSVKELFILEPF